MVRLPTDLLVANATAHAASGDWSGVRQLLAQHHPVALHNSELATLRAEADLRTGRPAEAHEWLGAVLPLLERSQNRRSLRAALNLRGVAELELGRLDEAELTFGRVIELARCDGDELLIARALNNLGALSDMRDRYDEALANYERAIPSYQRLGSARGLAETHHNVAISLRHQRRFEQADDHERRAIAYASDAQSPALECLARLGVAEIAVLTGDAALAEAIAHHTARRFADLDDPIREADAFRVMGAACLLQHKLEGARQAVDRALELAIAHDAKLLEAEVRRLHADLLWHLGDRLAAGREAEQAALLFESAGACVRAQEARAPKPETSSE